MFNYYFRVQFTNNVFMCVLLACFQSERLLTTFSTLLPALNAQSSALVLYSSSSSNDALYALAARKRMLAVLVSMANEAALLLRVRLVDAGGTLSSLPPPPAVLGALAPSFDVAQFLGINLSCFVLHFV